MRDKIKILVVEPMKPCEVREIRSEERRVGKECRL